jgi:hypothetical protein
MQGLLKKEGFSAGRLHVATLMKRMGRAGSGNLHIWDKCIFCLTAA